MSRFSKSWKKSSLLGCATLAALTAGTFGNSLTALADDGSIETVVVTGTQFHADSAPAKSSLDTTQPETIINRPYIEDFVDPQADYVTILSIVPGLTGGDINGPGLSDGGTKNTLRGLPDGNFNMQYDGIPFGDTNGPTHHNISYFPASTIGSALVDRGPGNAGTLGSNTYGGTIKLFSETLDDDAHVKGVASYGSFDTQLFGLNGQSGELDDLGIGKVKALVNLQDMQSKGALSGQDVYTKNALVKIEDQFAPGWTLTLFGDYSHLRENLDDNNGATPAQVAAFGKNFALQNDNPALPTYAPYNYTTKETDMDYVRLTGDVTDSFRIDNTVYTYAYWNHTFSPNSQEQTAAEIATAELGTCDATHVCFESQGTKIPSGPYAGTYSGDILAYDKQNYYRVWGDILRLSQDYEIGGVSGQIRAGVWWEGQATHRFKYYFDANICAAAGIDPFDVGGENAAPICGAKKGSAKNGVYGYAKDDEYSDWNQYEPFLEVDIKPTDNLTLTPGVKYIHWDRSVNAPVEQGSTCGVALACPPFNALGENYKASFTTTDTLPFAEANYKIEPSWSVYAQYAKGIYVPDISAFENKTPTGTFPQAETTTNYQFGTVYYADNFTVDADVYYIPINNNFISEACSYDVNETCFVNNGTATYEGIEGEGTYAFEELFGADVHGLSVFANGALMSSKAGDGTWETECSAVDRGRGRSLQKQWLEIRADRQARRSAI